MLVGYSKIGYLISPPACIRGPAFICPYRPRPRLLSEARPLIECRSLFKDLLYILKSLTVLENYLHRVCVCKKERERERERVCSRLVCVSVCVLIGCNRVCLSRSHFVYTYSVYTVCIYIYLVCIHILCV